MRTIFVAKVTLNGRVSLGSAMKELQLKDGDYVQFAEDQGRVFLQKVAPAEA
jgi:bifunctional DNA-binding transcriptional regulator/antitoxin component of YhaV-PrlF toxin-antitoxin module